MMCHGGKSLSYLGSKIGNSLSTELKQESSLKTFNPIQEGLFEDANGWGGKNAPPT